MTRLPPILALLGVLLVATPARADLGDISLVTGLSWDHAFRTDDRATDGLGALFGMRVGVADDWRMFAVGTYAGYVGRGARSDLMSLSVGASYLLDVVNWVPEFYAAVGYFGPGTSKVFKPDVGLVAGGGIEYRRYKEFGVGVRAEYRVLFRNLDECNGALAVGLFVAYHF